MNKVVPSEEVERLLKMLEGLLYDYDLLDKAFSDTIGIAYVHGYTYEGEKTKGYGPKVRAYLEAAKD